MDVLKTVLAARQDKSPQVQALLDCLGDAAFNLQVCICSVGGVGSTQLGNFLTQAGLTCNLLTDQDAIRHINRPPHQLSSKTKVVYLFGDPLLAVASHYRRDHALHQAQKTCGQPTKLDAASFPATFEAYVDRGEDLFGLQEHLDNWLNTPTDYNILFVRYELMFDLHIAEAMFNHLLKPAQGTHASSSSSSSSPPLQDPQHLASIFAALKRGRCSKVTKQQRQQMYTQLTAQMDGLPPLFLRTADCNIVPLEGLDGALFLQGRSGL